MAPRKNSVIAKRKNLDKARDAWREKRRLLKLPIDEAVEDVEGGGSVHADANGPEMVQDMTCGDLGPSGRDDEPGAPVEDQPDVAPDLRAPGEPEAQCNVLSERVVEGPVLDPVPGEQPNIENYDSTRRLLDERARIELARIARYAPLSHETARDALYKLDTLLRPPRATGAGYKPTQLNEHSQHRVGMMASCLRLYTDHNLKWSFTYASEIAAIGAGHGITYGQNIRKCIRTFVETGQIPERNTS